MSTSSYAFFGLDGAYSSTLLRALCTVDLRPILVVQGLPEPGRYGPQFEVHPIRTGLLSRWLDKPQAPEALPTSLRAIAHEMEIDLIAAENPGDDRCLAKVKAVHPSAFVVAGFHRLLPRSLLLLPRLGGINAHPGRLPEERGPSPVFWRLREGRTDLAFTLHFLDAGEDSGDVVGRGELRYEPGASLQEIYGACANALAPQLVQAVRDLFAGVLSGVPQNRERADRRPRPTFRDGRLDPALSAEAVYTFVAACARSHSLFVEIGGDRFFVGGAVSYDSARTLGFEYALVGDNLLLSCNPGVVELELKDAGAIFASEYRDQGPQTDPFR